MARRKLRAAILEQLWREGASITRAALSADCTGDTVRKYFGQLAAHGIPRGAVKPRHKRGPDWPAPYTGPDWIGVPAQ